jgi:hypothetical protein
VGDKADLATLASTIKQGVDNRLKDLHTAIPGIVETFDPVTQLATVQPAIRRIFITRDAGNETLIPSDLPILINVPVVFPRGGGFSLTFPVVKGDECLLVFCERSMDNWHETGEVKVPGARRFHSLSDATALVGLSSLPNKIPNYDDTNLQLKRDDNSVVFTMLTDGTAELKADTRVTVDVPNAEFTGNVLVKGNLTVEGSTLLSSTVTSGGTNISQSHTHSQGNDSAGNVEVDTGTPA